MCKPQEWSIQYAEACQEEQNDVEMAADDADDSNNAEDDDEEDEQPTTQTQSGRAKRGTQIATQEITQKSTRRKRN